MVGKADVVVENYEAGTMERLGLGYDVLKAANPRIIYASSTGYGQSGPNRNLPAFDPIVQAMTGIMALTGRPSDPPLKAGVIMCDVLGASHFVQRDSCRVTPSRQNRHRHDGRNFDAGSHIANARLTHRGALRDGCAAIAQKGNRASGGVITPANAYPASDGWVMILAADNHRWVKLCELMGRSDLAADERYKNSPAGRGIATQSTRLSARGPAPGRGRS